jgi:hypothetical protein
MNTKTIDGTRFLALAVVLVLLTARSAVSAQDQDRPSFVPDVVTKVILDPTTYTPTIVAWTATRLDWRSSQIFFRNGSVEHNPRYTVSGRVDDAAISYAAGNRQILMDAIGNLRLSLLHHTSARVVERLLMSRYPNHRKLLRAIGRIERSAMTSYLSYRLSARHLRQWRLNEQRAHQLGYD